MQLSKVYTLRASAAQAGAGTVTGDDSAGLLKLQDNFEQLNATLDVTAAATESGDLLDVYIDTSFDGGTNWINIGRFTQVTGNGGAKRFVLSFKAAPVASSNSSNTATDQSAGNALQIGFGDRIRYRGTVTESSTVNASFTYSITLFLKAYA